MRPGSGGGLSVSLRVGRDHQWLALDLVKQAPIFHYPAQAPLEALLYYRNGKGEMQELIFLVLHWQRSTMVAFPPLLNNLACSVITKHQNCRNSWNEPNGLDSC